MKRFFWVSFSPATMVLTVDGADRATKDWVTANEPRVRETVSLTAQKIISSAVKVSDTRIIASRLYAALKLAFPGETFDIRARR